LALSPRRGTCAASSVLFVRDMLLVKLLEQTDTWSKVGVTHIVVMGKTAVNSRWVARLTIYKDELIGFKNTKWMQKLTVLKAPLPCERVQVLQRSRVIEYTNLSFCFEITRLCNKNLLCTQIYINFH
jgi:hypothetical protein